MASNRTSGFDLLIQISEAELNNQVALAFAKGLPLDKTMPATSELLLPPSLQVPIDVLGITGTLDLNFQTPMVALDEPSPQVRFTIPFTGSQLTLSLANAQDHPVRSIRRHRHPGARPFPARAAASGACLRGSLLRIETLSCWRAGSLRRDAGSRFSA